MTTTQLLEKYNVQAPRYTSYPTVPFWQQEVPATLAWTDRVKATFDKNNAISLYIHLPYCERMCTFCGCNKRITKNHQVELPYIETLLKEWQLYLELFEEKPVIKELHLGGGTPTFFQPENLKYLITGILEKVELAEDYELGFEAHPASTSVEHLEVFYELGFRRISIGVQDFDEGILKIINRHQTYEMVETISLKARSLGYQSINFDLVFGLPLQTAEHIRKTIERVNILRPDRIAFYSYAHVPWVSPGQRAYSEEDLPLGEAKRKLYELGCTLLEKSGYHEIGMDHFALESDALYQAKVKQKMHRNFMGYTPLHTDLMIGLGASAISDAWTAYVQNEKKIEDYQARVHAGELPISRGHLLSSEDQDIRKHILQLMCQHTTNISENTLPDMAIRAIVASLKMLERDGLVRLEDTQLRVLPQGLPFIRNICMAFDQKLKQKVINDRVFSQVV